MTDNEKAATFIGWPEWPAQVFAPDMSDPRNYMRALEAVVGRYAYVSFGYMNADGWCFSLQAEMPIDGAYLIDVEHRSSPSDAAVAGLAALYDAENK